MTRKDGPTISCSYLMVELNFSGLKIIQTQKTINLLSYDACLDLFKMIKPISANQAVIDKQSGFFLTKQLQISNTHQHCNSF